MEGALASAVMRLGFLLCVVGFLDVSSALGNSSALRQWNSTSKVEPELPSKAFFINLDTSVERRAHMERELSQFSGRVERVDAVPFASVVEAPIAEMVQRQGLDKALKGVALSTVRKTIGCWLSHVRLWQRLVGELAPTETALVLEDDVTFPKGWHQDLNSTLMRNAPKGWAVLKLCGWGSSREADAVDENWRLVTLPASENGTWYYGGTCGYLVTGATLPKLLQRVLSGPVQDIDKAMMVDRNAKDAADSKDSAVYDMIPGRRLFETGNWPSIVHSTPEDDAAGNPLPDPPSRAFFINLNTSVERRVHMERELVQFRGRVERVDAVAHTTIDEPSMAEAVRQQGLLHKVPVGVSLNTSKKTVACWLSHVRLWQRLVRELRPTETALIMEDDVTFPEGWHQELNSKFIHKAPQGWAVLKVCGWGLNRAADTVDENWAMATLPLWENGKWYYGGTCGYIVAGATLPKLLKRVLSQPVQDIDVAMMVDPKARDAPANKDYACYEQRPGRRLLETGKFLSDRSDVGEGFGYANPTPQGTPEPENPAPGPQGTPEPENPAQGGTAGTPEPENPTLQPSPKPIETEPEDTTCTVAEIAGEEIQCDDVDVEFLPGSVVVIATITPPAGASVTASSLTEKMKEEASTVQQDLLTTIQNIPDINDFTTGTLEVSAPAVSTVQVAVPDPTPQPVPVPVPVPVPTPSPTPSPLDDGIPFGTADGAQSSMQLCVLACVIFFLPSFMWG